MVSATSTCVMPSSMSRQRSKFLTRSVSVLRCLALNSSVSSARRAASNRLTRFLVAVPHAAQAHLVALGHVGPQRLAQPSLVVRDDVAGGGEDVRRAAVVALEPDDGGAGEILLEAQDVADLRAAPAVDRLV